MHQLTVRTSAASLASALILTAGAVTAPSPGGAAPAAAAPGPATQAVIDWQRTAVRTIYVEAAAAPPVGALYLAFSSLAVREAVVDAKARNASPAAAAAGAAHDVLLAYFPSSQANLDADLDATLAGVPDGAPETRGLRMGRRAAARIVDERADDGRGDPSVVYEQPTTPGYWQPPSGGAMAAAWLGFVDPVVLTRPVALDGPDPLGSAAYAADYDEVRTVGRKTAAPTDRSADETAVARFFASNPMSMYRAALCDHLETQPLRLGQTVDLFALVNVAAADTFIQAWRWKYDVGFWRPFEAIARAAEDGNPATEPETGWEPLVANPPYSDYTSGHAAATSSFAEAVRLVLGDDVGLVLSSPDGSTQRSYDTLSDLEHDALDARVWGGLHFRDAMDDGYRLGHVTARRVLRALG